MELNSVLERVRKLIERAEHPGTNAAEAASCRKMADALMHKYAVDEALLAQAQDATQRSTPGMLPIVVCDGKNPARPWLILLTDNIARYCRCRTFVLGYGFAKNVTAQIYGYESDLKFFEIMWTVVYLHLGSQLSPKWDESADETANIVRLHAMGLNWLDIARLHPDPQYRYVPEIRRQDPQYPNQGKPMAVGSRIKRIYRKHCTDTDTPYEATGNRIRYIKSFAAGYQARLYRRIKELEARREAGSAKGGAALTLRNDGLDAWLAEKFPDTTPLALKTTHEKNWEAWYEGDRKGRDADLTGGTGRINDNATEEIGTARKAIS